MAEEILERRACISGIGQSDIGRRLQRDPLELTLDGRRSMTRMRPETSILDAALRVRPELPYSCKGGMCASCKARVVEGKVAMERNWALVDSEVDAGYVLTCQSHPLTDSVSVDYDV